MEKIRLGKTEIMASKIGFGCLPLQRRPMDEVIKLLRKAYDSGINYFDTARMYSDSEEKIGAALSEVRNHIYLATKSHHFTAEGILEDLDTSLRLMKTDHVDVLQVHNPPFCPKPGGEDGVYDAMLRAKKEGKLLHIGITNHREHVAREAIESGLYDLLQFPFAYLSSESEFKLKDDCLAADMGFVAMKPFGGGVLTDGGAVYHFFSTQKDVLPIYGMQHMWELEQMLGFLDNPPSEADAAPVIAADKAQLKGNFCRSCGYCLPCPMGIRVDMVMRSYYNLRRMPVSQLMNEEWRQMMEDTKLCIGCGACSSRCPYELDPPSRLPELYEDYMEHWNSYHAK